MFASTGRDSPGSPSPAFIALALFLLAACIVGGASRENVLGQPVIRTLAWAMLAGLVLFGRVWTGRHRGAFIVLGSGIVLAALQLVPLPPSIWTALPGRAPLADAGEFVGAGGVWRPISMSPGASLNALFSLVVPLCVLAVGAALDQLHLRRLLNVTMGLVALSALVAIVQFAGIRFDNPFTNDTPGVVSGLFANRNHFALFAAIGCLLAPAWAIEPGSRSGWKTVAAAGLVPLLILLILATGSRAGILLGLGGTLIGLFIMRKPLIRKLSALRSWIGIAVVGLAGIAVATMVATSFLLGRAASLDRTVASEGVADMRLSIFAQVWALIGQYMPLGTGVGVFDAIYRIDEPDAELTTKYINHAHNDFLELALNLGVAGIVLMACALAFFAFKSLAAWRGDPATNSVLPRLGSGAILLILLASLIDYPARTPFIMCVMAVAVLWLSAPQAIEASPEREKRQ